MIRLWVGLVLAVALLGGGWLLHHQAFRAGWDGGRATTLAEWHSDAARREALRLSELERLQRAAQEVERGLTEELAAADARGRDLAGRLRDALAPARTCSVPAAPSAASPPDGVAGKSRDQAELGAALASHLAACERDAERLGKLQDWTRQVIH